jgi:hypothetical protein
MSHKSRKRFGFADFSIGLWPRTGFRPTTIVIDETPLEKFPQRQIFAGSLYDPEAHIAITGTGA